MCYCKDTGNYEYASFDKDVDMALNSFVKQKQFEARADADVEARVRAGMLAQMEAPGWFLPPADI